MIERGRLHPAHGLLRLPLFVSVRHLWRGHSLTSYQDCLLTYATSGRAQTNFFSFDLANVYRTLEILSPGRVQFLALPQGANPDDENP